MGRWSRFDPFWRILFQIGLKPPTSIGWLVDLPECILSALGDDNQVHWTFAFVFKNARINALILQDSNEISDSRTWRYLTFDHTIAIHSQFANWHETFPLHGAFCLPNMPVKFTPLIILYIPWCFAFWFGSKLCSQFVSWQVVGLEECSVMLWCQNCQCWTKRSCRHKR